MAEGRRHAGAARAITCVAVLAVAALVAWSPWGTQYQGEGTNSSRSPGGPDAHPAAVRSGLSAEDIHYSPHLHQFDGGGYKTLISVYDFASLSADNFDGSPGLRLQWVQELGDPQDVDDQVLAASFGAVVPPDGRVELTQDYRLSFVPAFYAARDFQEIFIAGFPYTRDGVDETKLVIERWTFKYPDGYPVLVRASQLDGIGVPTAYSSPIVSIAGNVPPRLIADGDVVSENRELIYHGDALKGISGLVADPDGRYLLVTIESGELHMLDFDDPKNPILLADSATAPSLIGAWDPLLVEHQTLGRIAVIQRGPLDDIAADVHGLAGNHSRSVFLDSNNDGVFESITNVADGEWHFDLSGVYHAAADESLYVDGFVYMVP